MELAADAARFEAEIGRRARGGEHGEIAPRCQISDPGRIGRRVSTDSA